jgi:predicted lactoylglutathione lyase
LQSIRRKATRRWWASAGTLQLATHAFHANAMAQGAASLRKPGLRPDVNARYFGTMITDPDQHTIEVVHWLD